MSCGRFDGSSASISRAATVIVVYYYAVGDIDFCVYFIRDAARGLGNGLSYYGNRRSCELYFRYLKCCTHWHCTYTVIALHRAGFALPSCTVAIRPAGKYKSAVRHACDVRAVARRTELSKCSPLLRWRWREVYIFFFFVWCDIMWRERSDLERRRSVTATRRCESRDVQWAGRP